MFIISFRNGLTVAKLASLTEKYLRNSLSSPSNSASGFNASIPSHDEARDSDLESVSDYRLHNYAFQEYCNTVRDVQTSFGIKESSAFTGRIEKSFFTSHPRHGCFCKIL